MRKPVVAISIVMLLAIGFPAEPRTSSLTLDETARYLAGTLELPVNDTLYQNHCKAMDMMWQKIDATIQVMKKWVKEKDHRCPAYIPVLYPLSGADIINVFVMYPHSRRYVLMALEDPGDVPRFHELSAQEKNSSLGSLRNSVWNMAVTNYFWSRVMRKEMSDPHVHGTLPVVMAFLSRMGMKIKDVDKMVFRDNGRLRTTWPWEKKKPHDGYRLTFRVPGEWTNRTLIYVKMKVEPGMFDNNDPKAAFMKSYGEFALFMKSAIYLLHRPDFQDTARFLADRSVMVIQDDSGVPFRYLNTPKREHYLYGRYVKKPYLSDLPDIPFQRDLAEAFRVNHKKLPFKFGYGISTGSSSIIVSVKKGRCR